MSRKSSGFRTPSREGKQRELQSITQLKENRHRELSRSRRAVALLGAMIIAVCCIGAVAAWRGGISPAPASLNGSPNGAAASSSSAAMPLAPPPAMPANAPTKEYIYAGSALLATSEPSREVPDDLAVWRPTDGGWYVLKSSDQQLYGAQFGTQDDIPVPEDYDGDGKTDLCVFRPSTHAWYMLRSSDNSFFALDYGNSTDKPLAADFDGDGKADIALYRSSAAAFYVRRSSDDAYIAAAWGVSGDTPVPADYDGDRRADYAVRHNNVFQVYKSGDGLSMTSAPIGNAGDEPVVADYDGDGRADYAVRGGSTNLWSIIYSSTGTPESITWGYSTDIAVPGNYRDGDGKSDIAVWRPSNGVWYVRQSKDGALDARQWGANGDTPVPAPYRR